MHRDQMQLGAPNLTVTLGPHSREIDQVCTMTEEKSWISFHSRDVDRFLGG